MVNTETIAEESQPTSPAVVEAVDLSFAYPNGVRVFGSLNLAVQPGALTCVTGPSGVGKSTLLYCVAGVLASSGTIVIAGDELTDDPSQRARVRLQKTGFVFQRGELLPELSIVENVALPLRLTGSKPKDALEQAKKQLSSFGISDCADRAPNEVSGGQAQRASVARALITKPKLIFADEPTSSLDEVNRRIVVEALLEAAAAGAAVLCATHDETLVAKAAQVLEMVSAR